MPRTTGQNGDGALRARRPKRNTQKKSVTRGSAPSRAGRPRAVTPELAAAIASGRATGIRQVSALHRWLENQGYRIARRTLGRYLAGEAAYEGQAPPAPAPAKPPEPSDPARAAQQALEGEPDLAELERVAGSLRGAMAGWEPKLSCDGGAVRAYATLSRALADVLARCAELRPRADVEREAVLEAGSGERDVLVQRVREAARQDDDLRGQLNRYKAHLEMLRSKADS